MLAKISCQSRSGSWTVQRLHALMALRAGQKTMALCQMFTKAFKDKNGVTPKQVFELVQQMRKTTTRIHDAGVLIVDCNEMNFLVPYH